MKRDMAELRLEHDCSSLSDAGGVRSHALHYICLTYGSGLASPPPRSRSRRRPAATTPMHVTLHPDFTSTLAVNTASYLAIRSPADSDGACKGGRVYLPSAEQVMPVAGEVGVNEDMGESASSQTKQKPRTHQAYFSPL